MQQITISGTLVSDAQQCVDKRGRKFVRFTLTCGSADVYGKINYNHYQCVCYIPGYEKAKKGDQLFLTGRFTPSVVLNENKKAELRLDVMVLTISGGYTANERSKK